MDRYSPLAPAFVRVLVLPVGHIERKRFTSLLDKLKQDASIVTLGDVESRVGDAQLLLHPKAFPRGRLLYNYTTSVPSELHYQLSPYELFREPLLVIGIVDGLGEGAPSGLKELGEASRYLREKHQRVVHRQLVVIDGDGRSDVAPAPDDVVHITEAALVDTALLTDAVLEVSVRFLNELSTYTRALQASPSIQTPGQTARSLQRPVATREVERASSSGHSTPTQAASPVDSSGVRTPPYGRSSPATSFDQIATNAQNALSRSESRASARARHGGRAPSQDRVSVQGFGSMSQEKLKSRGKARVGIVTGHLYMMAGQWDEGLKILIENTHKARTLPDFLWHAKGMESIVVCLLLHAWAGIEFQIPTIIYPIADRVASGHSQRFSITLPSDFRTAEAAQKAALHRLSNYLPDLVKQILNLYDSGEASLELPFLVVSEATLRCCKLLLILQRNTELSQEVFKQLLDVPQAPSDKRTPLPGATSAAQRVSNSTIANMLADAQPMADDNVPLPDHVAVLAGTASVYTSIGMKRKRATTLRDMIVKLTHALSQARRRGAADMGIHPAAALSAENGAEAILAATELSGGLHQMLENVAVSFGSQSLDGSTDAAKVIADASGNDTLKQLVLTELSAFCEASPDLQGLLRVNTALLRACNSRGAADTRAAATVGLSQEEQIRLTSTISRSVGISKHLGLPKLEATYWDAFLVRDVMFVAPDRGLAVVSRASLRPGSSPSQQSSTNPLLYDPNASRPGTAASVKPVPAELVQGEPTVCIIKVQNTNEVPIEIESIHLVTEGVGLATDQQVFTLGPLRVQEIPLSVTAHSTGECNITAARIKINGCAEQDFPIYRQAWAAQTPSLIKHIGQEAGVLAVDRGSSPVQEIVTANVIEAQPLLILENTSLVEEGLMLLDGESVEVDVILRNDSSTTAALVEFITANDTLTLLQEPADVNVPARQSTNLKLRVRGRAGLSRVQATFAYGHSDDESKPPDNVRMLSVAVDVTVNASLQLHNLDLLPNEGANASKDTFMISLDIGNAWPKSLDFKCAVVGGSTQVTLPGDTKAEGVLAPGQIQRIFLSLSKPSLPHDAGTEALRDALVQGLVGGWSGDGRKGQIDFSKLRPSTEVLEALRSEPIELRLDIVHAAGPSPERHSTVKAGAFTTIRARVTTRMPSTTPLVVNLQSRSHDAADVGIEERLFAVAGPQHRILPPLQVGKGEHLEFVICPLLAGSLVLVASVRPAQMLREVKAKEENWCVQRTLRLRVV